MSIEARFYSHNSYDDVYSALARLFPPKISGTTQWVAFTSDDIEFCFFGPDLPGEDPDDDEEEAA